MTFNPTVEGQADAVLTLTTNDVARQTVSVSLSGYGGRPLITVTPTALDFQGVEEASPPARAVHELVRTAVAFVDEDRGLHPQIDELAARIVAGEPSAAAEAALGQSLA